MVDLEKLEQEIDNLLEKETKSTLEKWLFNKRYNKINKIIGKGTFVSLKTEGSQFRGSFSQPIFNTNNTDNSTTPSNRLAA